MKKSMTLEQLAEWLEYHCNGFYGGCRVDEHSPQVREFVDALHYYLEVNLGYISKRRKHVVKFQKKYGDDETGSPPVGEK